PEVEFSELDRKLAVEQITPNDPFDMDINAWALQKINGPNVWAMSTGSPNMIIAILALGSMAGIPILARTSSRAGISLTTLPTQVTSKDAARWSPAQPQSRVITARSVRRIHPTYCFRGQT